MVLLLRKLYLYFTKIQRRSIIFFGGGGGGGVQMLISMETHISRGGGVRTPYPPLDLRMGNVIITGQYVSQSGF